MSHKGQHQNHVWFWCGEHPYKVKMIQTLYEELPHSQGAANATRLPRQILPKFCIGLCTHLADKRLGSVCTWCTDMNRYSLCPHYKHESYFWFNFKLYQIEPVPYIDHIWQYRGHSTQPMPYSFLQHLY